MSSVSIDAETLRELVAQAQDGNRAAADRLVREHDGWVRSAVYAVTGRPDLVDDIAQQVWTRVWERLRTLENPRRLRAWLYSVARNTAIDASAATGHRRAAPARAGGHGVASRTPGWRRSPARQVAGDRDERHGGNPLGVVAGSEEQELVLEAVRALPALYREPLVLRHLQDWSYAEIAQVLGLTEEAVETRLVRARRMLREMLLGKVEP